jgi:YidC/Oxa1 family membrane protein insertase
MLAQHNPKLRAFPKQSCFLVKIPMALSMKKQMILMLLMLCMITTSHATQLNASSPCATAVTEILAEIPIKQTNLNCNNQTANLSFTTTSTQKHITLSLDDLPISPQKPFYGLAGYYNDIYVYHTNTGWLAAAGRYQVLMIKANKADIQITDTNIALTWPDDTFAHLQLGVVPKANLNERNPEWGDLRYQHLWDWLASISKSIEWSLVMIQKHVVSSWGWAIVIFAILVKLLLLPLSLFTARLQHKVSYYQSMLIPQLTEIKKNYDGEAAHQRIMAAHKKLGITPFYTLKPMVGILILLPILVATFNTLGEMPQLANASFLWIKDLAYPDAIFTLPFTIPFFGNTFNLLPFIMSIVIIFSTPLFQHQHTPALQAKRQKRNLFLMAIAFFVLFYPFPAAMVLYWTLANLLQAIQQKFLKQHSIT